MHCYCKYIFATVLGLGAILIMMSTPAIPEWPVSQRCLDLNFHSFLQQIWCWLSLNKDSTGSLVQILGVISVVFAARSFFRTQQLNQATAVFQMMKEGRDLLIKLSPTSTGSPLSDKTKLWLNLNFHASIFQYRHLKFVDDVTWKPFEEDLEGLMLDEKFVNWLSGRTSDVGLPAAEKFDLRFIIYLKAIHQRVTKAVPPGKVPPLRGVE